MKKENEEMHLKEINFEDLPEAIKQKIKETVPPEVFKAISQENEKMV